MHPPRPPRDEGLHRRRARGWRALPTPLHRHRLGSPRRSSDALAPRPDVPSRRHASRRATSAHPRVAPSMATVSKRRAHEAAWIRGQPASWTARRPVRRHGSAAPPVPLPRDPRWRSKPPGLDGPSSISPRPRARPSRAWIAVRLLPSSFLDSSFPWTRPSLPTGGVSSLVSPLCRTLVVVPCRGFSRSRGFSPVSTPAGTAHQSPPACCARVPPIVLESGRDYISSTGSRVAAA